MKQLFVPTVVFVAAALAACASGVRKVDLPATTVPTEELAKVQGEVARGFQAQWDVLAEEPFSKAQAYVEDAQTDLAKGRDTSRILKDLGYAHAYLNEAASVASNQEPKVRGLIEARRAAIDAGARDLPAQKAELGRLDDQTRRLVGSSMSTTTFSRVQGGYFDLELASIEGKALGAAEANIHAAESEGASSYAPRALKGAQVDIVNARNKIAADRRKPEQFADAVKRATESALFVLEVTKEARSKKDIGEATASDIVRQRQQINSLQGSVQKTQANMAEMGQKIVTTGEKLEKTLSAEQLSLALAKAEKAFPKSEADVYRVGPKLLVRMKNIRFKVGKSDVPPTAHTILAKVSTVAKDLRPLQVMVYGNADGTGNTPVNIKLSQDRASAVAKYLASNGIEEDVIQSFGQAEEVPVGVNKTTDGRAKNRRVDVLITPSIAK